MAENPIPPVNNRNNDVSTITSEAQENDKTRPPGSAFARLFKQFRYLVFSGACIAGVDLIKDMFINPPNIDFEKMERCTNHVAVMTGGPRGIGFDIVKKLLQLDYTVILGVRNITTSGKGIDAIRKLGITSGRTKLLQLDLKSLQSVRRFASDVIASSDGQRIDLLLNNAGIMNVPYEKTEDNFEVHFQVNYLAHFLLTNLLLPRIKETALRKNPQAFGQAMMGPPSQENGPCIIVNTSSHSQRGGRIDFDELETSKVYSPVKCYFDSKLCQVVHAKILERMFQEEGLNIHAYAVHPGEIPTDLWLELGCLARFRPIVKYICRTTDGAADTVLYPALTPKVIGTHGGQYFESGRVITPNPQVTDPGVQNRLWERSLQLTSK